MKDVFDSLEDYPVITMQDVSEPLTRFHPGETEVVVQLSDRHSLSFFLNDTGLINLQRATKARQKIRAIQRTTHHQYNPDCRCGSCNAKRIADHLMTPNDYEGK